jgi:SWI/SNF-related matrix-associated actin-dependent regulator of chromatin subfamily A3
MSFVLPDDLHPKTPVCIGQLTTTALVLYPVSYLQRQDSNNLIEWANVHLRYEHNPQRVGATETIHIKTPSSKTLSGELSQGETFGVVEQKVATDIGPTLGKGLIRLDAKVRRGSPNVSDVLSDEPRIRSFALPSFLYCLSRCGSMRRKTKSLWLAIICNHVV